MPPPTVEQYLSNCFEAALQDERADRCEDLGLEPRPYELNHTLIKGAGAERRVILYRHDLSELRATAAEPPPLPPYHYQGAELRQVLAERQGKALTDCAQGLSTIAGKMPVYPELLGQLPNCQNLYGASPTLHTDGLRWTEAGLELTAPLADGSSFRWPTAQRPGLPPEYRRGLHWLAGLLLGGALGVALGWLARTWGTEPRGGLARLGQPLASLTLLLGLLTAPLTLPNLTFLGEASMTMFPMLMFGTLPALCVVTLVLAGMALSAAGLWSLLLTPFLAGGLLGLLWSGLPFAQALTLGAALGLPLGGWLGGHIKENFHKIPK
ncbi:hypothetical protein Deipr_0960 [Deinococcus proteolyticus MRP]|uniref:Uncharacterized protein n=3 Tax=Deinococcus TaxID=1298 RepID=F0RMX4_DEIPM|nr:hypothetical protein Deipr_0960 [Deinococcus proteolyticus MRP]